MRSRVSVSVGAIRKCFDCGVWFSKFLATAMTLRKRTANSLNKSENIEKKQETTRISYFRLLILFIILVAGCYSVYWVNYYVQDSFMDKSDSSSTPDFIKMMPVNIIKAQPSEPFAVKVSDLKVPVVIKNSVTQTWPAFKKWNPSYLAKKISSLKGVYENSNRWFGPYYDKSKPLTHLSAKKNSYRTDLVLKGHEFFELLEHPKNNSHLYFTGGIDDLGPWAWKDVQPIEELLSLNPIHSSINVWMGQPHVIAHCHYDGYHNFYAQLYGRKRFTMFRPTEWPGVYPYPFLHPSHAQAQVNISDDTSISMFPAVRHVEGYQVLLEPGDLLYMPPLWFHHVEAVDVSISVNVWTGSTQSSVMEKIFALESPLQRVKWRKQIHKSISTAFAIYSVVSEVCRVKNCINGSQDKFSDVKNATYKQETLDKVLYFVKQLWKVRYEHLFLDGTLPKGNQHSPILCKLQNSYIELVDEMLEVYYRPPSLQYYIMDYSASVGKLAIQLPSDTWELWIGNYVEYLAATAVGPDHAGYFLKNFDTCFDLLLKEINTLNSQIAWWLPVK